MVDTALTARAPTPVIGVGDLIAVTLSLDTNAYADNDVLANFQEVPNFVRAQGGRAIIQSLTVLDKDDQGQDIDIFITPNASASLGTENAAVDITDAHAEGVQKVCSITSADYDDLVNCQIATIRNIGLVVEAADGETSMHVGAVLRSGTPTYTASGLILYFGVLWD